MVAFFRDLSPVLILSYRILEMRPSCGVWRQPRGSVAYGHDCFVGPWYYLVFVFSSIIIVMPF